MATHLQPSALEALADDCAALGDPETLEALADAVRMVVDRRNGVPVRPEHWTATREAVDARPSVARLSRAIAAGDTRAAGLCSAYLHDRATAIRCRLDGEIATARECEARAGAAFGGLLAAVEG